MKFDNYICQPDTDVYIGANDGTNRFVEDRLAL